MAEYLQVSVPQFLSSETFQSAVGVAGGIVIAEGLSDIVQSMMNLQGLSRFIVAAIVKAVTGYALWVGSNFLGEPWTTLLKFAGIGAVGSIVVDGIRLAIPQGTIARKLVASGTPAAQGVKQVERVQRTPGQPQPQVMVIG